MRMDGLTKLKNAYSTCLLLFSFFIVISLMFTENTKLSQHNPLLALFLMLGAVVLLNMVEGGQAALVGLAPVDRDLFRGSHPMATKICEVAHRGENLDRYLIGRQFIVVALVFLINLCGAPLQRQEDDIDVWSMPDMVVTIFLEWSVAMILITTMAGQLNSLVNASHCMLDYINNYFGLFTVYIALGLEASGLLHACYLIQYFLSFVSRKPIESREGPRSCGQNLFFWGRVLFSCGVLGCSMYVTVIALFEKKTTMHESASDTLSVALFFGFLVIAGK